MSPETFIEDLKAENDYCCVCFRSKSEVKLSAISPKMCQMFFVGFVKCVESSMIRRKLCCWCSKRIGNALQLVESAQTTDRILAYIVQSSNAHCETYNRLVWDQIQAIKRMHRLTSKYSRILSLAGVDFSTKLERDSRASDDDQRIHPEGGSSDQESDVKDPLGTKSRGSKSDQLRSPHRNVGKKLSNPEMNYVTNMRVLESGHKGKNDYDAPKLEFADTIGDPQSLTCVKKQNLASECEFGGHFDRNASESNESCTGMNKLDVNLENVTTYTQADAPKYIRCLRISEAQRQRELVERRCDARYALSMYKCDACVVGFTFKSTYEAHMDQHTEYSGSYECSVCGVHLSSARSLRSHTANHYRRHVCKLCGFTRAGRHAVISHYLVTHTAERHICEHCGGGFCKSSALKLHMRTVHNRERVRFTCPRCSKTLNTRFSYNMHMMRHESGSGNAVHAPHSCTTCGLRFRTAGRLRAHMATHVPPDERALCRHCRQLFKSPAALASHIKRKHTMGRYECDYCQKTFSVKADLRQHICWTHLRQGFDCQFCSKVLRTSFLLRRHVEQKHEGVAEPRDKLCEVCGKGFSHNSTLKVHRRIHTGERPYHCTECPAAFTQGSTLNTHRKLVHKLKKQPGAT